VELVKVVYKYPLNVGVTEINVDDAAKVLSAQIQGENGLRVWIEVTTNGTATHKLTFDAVGTGQPFEGSDHEWNYLSTFQMFDGSFVFHVYYKREAL
jgi:hypothetical protein